MWKYRSSCHKPYFKYWHFCPELYIKCILKNIIQLHQVERLLNLFKATRLIFVGLISRSHKDQKSLGGSCDSKQTWTFTFVVLKWCQMVWSAIDSVQLAALKANLSSAQLYHLKSITSLTATTQYRDIYSELSHHTVFGILRFKQRLQQTSDIPRAICKMDWAVEWDLNPADRCCFVFSFSELVPVRSLRSFEAIW